jgi:hypothetical protein
MEELLKMMFYNDVVSAESARGHNWATLFLRETDTGT